MEFNIIIVVAWHADQQRKGTYVDWPTSTSDIEKVELRFGEGRVIVAPSRAYDETTSSEACYDPNQKMIQAWNETGRVFCSQDF